MFQASVPPILSRLETLSAILDKGAAFAAEQGIDPAELIEARLAPDMFPLARQVQIASDITKGGVARLAGVEAPSWPDEEASFPELKERLANTRSFIETIGAEQIDGSEDRAITVPAGAHQLHFRDQAYLLDFVLPNLYFHMTAAYLILRHKGVDVGKSDFLGL